MNNHTHYYLYAKGHYKGENLVEDLQKIQEQYTSCPAEYITSNDIVSVLLPLVFRHLHDYGNPDYFFTKFIAYLDENDIFGHPKNMHFHERVISACLSILRYVRIENLNLGEADPKILPLCEN